MRNFQEILDQTPSTVAWKDVVELEHMDERLPCIDCLFVNILGINEENVEWCPNNNPPSVEEKLAWIWFIRPDLPVETLPQVPTELKKLIEMWWLGKMDTWWKDITECAN